MSRRTYGVLQIARRHPRLFTALHRSADDRADVRDGSDGYPRANAAMRFALECEAATAQLRTLRGEPYIFANVPWRSDAPARRRYEPRASRFGDLEQTA